VVSGHSGGNGSGRPTYRQICSGLSSYAEVVQVTFVTGVISYEDISVIFMTSHDPTTLNEQGADRGSQYRSVIYYHDNLQKNIAEVVSKEGSSYYENPIITEVSALDTFYEAEKEHQNYYKNNQTQGYCSFVIRPKLTKLSKHYRDKLKN
jgi:peptide-methionine (S)-S-oxide reductase